MTARKIAYSIAFAFCAFFLVVLIKLITDEVDTAESLSEDKLKDEMESDSVSLAASTVYDADSFKSFLQGNNYRESWATKVRVPKLKLDTLFGGASIVKEGGGNQTRSLRLATKDGLLLTLRSVNKNPEPLVPDYLRNLNLENIVLDGISGQHPYAASVVAKLSEAVNIMHTNPKLCFLVEQPELKKKYGSYANKLYWLEYENKGEYNWTSHPDVQGLVDTEDLQELKQFLKDSLQVDKDGLIRARLFDIVVGDWDRHAKQWGWVIQRVGDGYKALPLPVDRDNAFFDVEGLLNSVLSSHYVTPRLQNFESQVEYIEGQVYDFDVYFLQNTSFRDFIQQAVFIQERLNDGVIEEAFEQWNTELFNLNARQLIKKIKTRRNNLKSIAAHFFTTLDRRPLLTEPLKGTDASDTEGTSIQCFECY